MPLLMIDLDNTLLDRGQAFRAAAGAFLSRYRLPVEDLGWLVSVDASGYAPRRSVAEALADRYGAAVPGDGVRELLDHGVPNHVALPASTSEALGGARAAGWTCVIVTNGRTVQQETKIRRTGLDLLVHGWVVSESLGHRKPEPEIFRAAAALGGADLADAWMIGDSPQADIAGAHALGVATVWVSAGRRWDELSYSPSHTAPDIVTAISQATGSHQERTVSNQ